VIPHNRPTLGQLEADAAAKVIASGWVAQGPEVEAFEAELCDFLCLPPGHAVAVSSGSAALYLALWALNAQGKKVGVPVYSCASLRNAVGLIGAQPTYLDCGPGTPNADWSTSHLESKDILILPSMYGIPSVIQPETAGPKIIEDIAQAIGATVEGRRIGARGDVGVCSFYATKLLTSGGQGGAVFSRDKALIDSVRDYRAFDCRNDEALRFNFQMTDIQAAIGRVQLARLPEFLRKRAHLFAIYRSVGLNLLGTDQPNATQARLRAVVRTASPTKVIQALEKSGVRAIIPIETRELLDEPSKYPRASELCQSTVSLPVYPSLSDADAINIANITSDRQT
jgi:perosamine synthetase